MADDSGIDPRYAAQFQRGFDPTVHAPAPAPGSPTRPTGPRRISSGPPKSAERVPDPPRIGLPPRSPQPNRETAAEAAPPSDDVPAPGPGRVDRPLALLGVALLFVAGSAVAGSTAVGTDLSMMYDPAAELPRAAFRTLPGPLVGAGLVLLAVAVTPLLATPRLRTIAVSAIPVALVLLTLAGLALTGAENVRVQEYWSSGNPTLEQQVEIARIQGLVQMMLSAVPWLAASVIALIVLALRAFRGAGQRGASASSATASRDA